MFLFVVCVHIRLCACGPVVDTSGDACLFDALVQRQVAAQDEGVRTASRFEVVEACQQAGEVVGFGLRFSLGVVQGEGEQLLRVG